MSRIGKLPITIPSGVSITVNNENTIIVKGPKGELSQRINPEITIKQEENTLFVQRPSDQKHHKALHGLYRALISNMIVGVSEGYKIVQELVGVGYKASNVGQLLELSLGFSHNVFFELPQEVKVETITERGKNPLIILESYDKQLIGQVAAKIRGMRKPEPYKGKGVRFQNEVIRRKAGKSASAK
ncbi:MAG: 50S ribosomal protein L6 [Bacteroidetes bacterium]|nr:50S ribosomal protein L6 [Bacteroidota bacterium]